MSWLSEGIDVLASLNTPIVGGVISGTATLIAAGFVTWRLNRGIKRAEFVLQFAERYHAIMSKKHRLNKKYLQVRQSGQLTDEVRAIEAMDAKELYRQLFGLMFDEFFSYQRHLLDQEVFSEWMKWRMDDFNGRGNDEYKVCDMSYQDGWNEWKDRGPFRHDPCKQFLHEIHQCQNYRSVARKVRRYKPTMFWRAVRWVMGT